MIIGAVILFAIAVLSFVMGIFSLFEKGFLLNNAYIYASKEEREAMNKSPYYRQSATVLLMVGLIFLLNAFDLIFKTEWIIYIVAAGIIITLIYAVASSVMIEKNNKK